MCRQDTKPVPLLTFATRAGGQGPTGELGSSFSCRQRHIKSCIHTSSVNVFPAAPSLITLVNYTSGLQRSRTLVSDHEGRGSPVIPCVQTRGRLQFVCQTLRYAAAKQTQRIPEDEHC
ncbi:hypothetical protein DPX16_5726 [Anabarilius grahami]|uniref:Uncharacterized protein n=1 Tax=Anabarilius grahami TaxID=495550 RepID=A0A3N0YQ44_ANAGA|nr:hypothetical protein DPX16_5726 [Anabarilius grahami]